jgi:hypothetical protein
MGRHGRFKKTPAEDWDVYYRHVRKLESKYCKVDLWNIQLKVLKYIQEVVKPLI